VVYGKLMYPGHFTFPYTQTDKESPSG